MARIAVTQLAIEVTAMIGAVGCDAMISRVARTAVLIVYCSA